MTFNEVVGLQEENKYSLIREKGSVRYYGKQGWDRRVRVDYHETKEVPTGSWYAILKAAGIRRK